MYPARLMQWMSLLYGKLNKELKLQGSVKANFASVIVGLYYIRKHLVYIKLLCSQGVSGLGMHPPPRMPGGPGDGSPKLALCIGPLVGCALFSMFLGHRQYLKDLNEFINVINGLPSFIIDYESFINVS